MKDDTFIDQKFHADQGSFKKNVDVPDTRNVSPMIRAERSAKITHKAAHTRNLIQATGKKLTVHSRRQGHSFVPNDGRSWMPKKRENTEQRVGVLGGEWAIVRPGVRASGQMPVRTEKRFHQMDMVSARQAAPPGFFKILKELSIGNTNHKFSTPVGVAHIKVKGLGRLSGGHGTKSLRKLNIGPRSNVTNASIAATMANRDTESKFSDRPPGTVPVHVLEVKLHNSLDWEAASSEAGAVYGVREPLSAITALPNNLLRALDEYFMRQARLPPSGVTAFDPRLTPAWAGVKIPM